LIRGFGEFGVTNFVATPHIMNNLYPNTPETINASLDKLRDTLLDNGLREVAVDAAAEHMIDDNFEAILEKGEVMPLRNEHLLVEMSFLQAPINFDQAIGKITSKWLFPVLAHPERYKFLHQRMNKYARFREQGILLQMNLLSLGDYYDKEVQKMALKLLDEGLINFVASDVHRIEHLEVLKETTLPDKVITQLIPVIHNTIETFY
jgi:tyrosine-protein phosphatase YwqE